MSLYKQVLINNPHLKNLDSITNELFFKVTKSGKRATLLQGLVQSGKTDTFLGLAAKMFDAGYSKIIIITKSSLSLALQTEKRVFNFFNNEGEAIGIYSIKESYNDLTPYEIEMPSVFILKKHEADFKKIQEMIGNNPQLRLQKTLIIDDESDFASVGYDKNVKNPEERYKAICEAILTLRETLPRANYLSVTATPYVLYLSKNWMIRPSHTILLPPHKDYFGSEYLFLSEDPKAIAIRENFIEQSEFDNILARNFEIEGSYLKEFLGITTALLKFMLGGLIRNRQEKERVRLHYSMLIHIDTRKEGHSGHSYLVKEIITELKNKIEVRDSFVLELIDKCYKELLITVTTNANQMNIDWYIPKLLEGLEKEVKIVVMNSDNYSQVPTDSDGNIKNPTPYTIFIGAYSVDRGVTFKNLISFVFGRSTKVALMDSSIQQMRIFGARLKKDLEVTRVYSTEETTEKWIAISSLEREVRSKVHIMEKAQQLSQKMEFTKRITNVLPSTPAGIKYGNTQKIDGKQKKLHFYSRILPKYFNTISDNEKVEEIVESINRNIAYLKSHYPSKGNKNKEYITISTDDALSLVETAYAALEPRDGREINTLEQTIFALLLFKEQGNDQVHLYTRYNRKRKAIRSSGQFDDSPDSGKGGDRDFARFIAIDCPVLSLLHQDGTVDDGFNDCPFFWPILTLPKKLEYDLLTLH